MARSLRRFLRMIPALLLAFVLGLPLRAQLDPRLQGSTTDFLDLYQQSSQAKVKPEILTIFDFSGSMQALMYHPRYVNTDTSDQGAASTISFTWNAGQDATNQTYTVRATSRRNPSVYTEMAITVGGAAGSPWTIDEQWEQAGNRWLATRISDLTITPSGTVNAGTTYTFSATVTMRVTDSRGRTKPFSEWMSLARVSVLDGGIDWTITGGSGATAGMTSAAPSSYSATTWTSAAQTYSWKAVVNTGVDPYVTAAFSSFGNATCTQLVKPNGAVVTKADADAASSTSGFYGAGAGSNDVRNWVRAASHARFVYNDNGVTRTVDIPIPWKVTDRASSGNPLSSRTIRDRITKVSSDGKSTDYGSDSQIELDLNYAFSGGSYVLNGSTSTRTSTTLRLVSYNNDYLTWLFTGKYQGSNSSAAYYCPSYSGKYIVFDAATGNLAGGQGNSNVGWGQGYGNASAAETILAPQLKLNGSYDKEVSISASANVVPALTRCQAVKVAAIQTWIQYQADVIWAFRFLDPGGQYESSDSINNDSTANDFSGDPITSATDGNGSKWVLLNNTGTSPNTQTSGNSVKGMKCIASLFANNGTPLTYAMARGLAQFTDPNSVLNAAYGDTAPSQCMSHFLILFTDGVDNNNSGTDNPNRTTPYLVADSATGKTTINAATGNYTILQNKSQIDRYGTYWNLFTFAGLGAHMADSSLGVGNYQAATNPGSSATSGSPSSFLPFAIKKRGSTTFDHDHRITTMTVGVSLGGQYTDSSSPKRSLFLGAAVGDTTLSSWPDLDTLTPFQWDPSLNNGNGGRVPGSLYFFDATDPDGLSTNLNYAIQSAIGASLINVTSNPNLPYIGASLGKQIYLGKFQPPKNGGVLWSGDLLMFPTKVDSSGGTVILDKSGNATSTLDASTAVWSAAYVMRNQRRWDARNLFTRVPGTSTTPEPGLSSFTYTGSAYTNDATATPPGLKNYVATASSASYPPGGTTQQSLIQLVMGANLMNPFSTTNATANRTNIMGDIINSSPSYLEYKWSEVSGRFPTGTHLQSGDRNRFRLLLVGDNQGWLHAFGETTQINSVAPDATKPNSKVDLVTGEVDELWAFMPTDFLANLDYLNSSTNAHKFMVDGSPTIYFLDLPTSSGGIGNGVLDGSNVTISNSKTDTTHERAIAIIGLRKGGRSYYAINLHDPFNPTLQWSLVPDEAGSLPSSRNLTGLTDSVLRGIVANMGYSTSTPSIGRILYGGVYKDVVFLGGGLSVPEIETKFTGSPRLGRSILALDVNTGDILAAVDLTSSSIGGTSIGPISAGVVPFEFFLGSGMTQRAYFLDMWGGLWCWGSKQVVSDTTSSYNKFRMDSSDLKHWTSDGSAKSAIANTGVRKVYQDANSVATTSSGTTTFAGPLYTTLPAPFLVGTFPGKGHTDGTTTTAIPAAVGIAMVSGNRNDPLDFGSNKPANTRLTVVFDRQDSRAWSLDTEDGPDAGIKAQLLNAGKWGADGAKSSTLAYGDTSISPGSSAYYLAPSTASDTKFGYYVTFPDKQQDTKNTSTYHYSKGINPPLVVSDSAYYSYFTPTTADVCTGGSGYTYSNKICDVMNPVMADARSGLICTSGKVDRWINVASDFSMLGAPGVQQAGTRSTTDPNDSSKIVTFMDTSTYLGQGQQRYPKIRVWRTVR